MASPSLLNHDQDAKMYQPPRPDRVIVIDEVGDLFINLYEAPDNGDTFDGANGTVMDGRILESMQVSRAVIAKSSSKNQSQLYGPWLESTQKTVDIECEHVRAMELWMRVLHETMTEDMYEVVIEVVWHAIQLARSEFFELERLNGWFVRWYNTVRSIRPFEVEQIQQLLYPCHEFEYREGFAEVSKKLAYEMEGHIREENPTPYRHLHLEPRIIGGLNAARGNLKTRIHQDVYIQRRFLRSRCSCKKDGLYEYELALDKTGAWPLEDVLQGKNQISIRACLNSLRTFNYVKPNNNCKLCSSNFDFIIVKAVQNIEENFDGLCLDCVDNPSRGDWDVDYDFHNSRRSYDDCSINHGQPTGYFSWLCRKQKSDYFARAREDRKRKRFVEDEVANKRIRGTDDD